TGNQPCGPVVFVEITLQKVPRLAVVGRNKPTFPYIHAARRLAKRFRLENRPVLELLPEVRLIRDAPLRYGCGCGRRRSAARFSKSRFDSPANVLFVIICLVSPHIARWGSLRSIENRTIRRSFDCHRATTVLRICAGVDDQFVAGLQSISQSFELFLISIWCRWLALIHPSHCRVYREKEQKTKAGESDGAGNVH